MKGPYSSPPYWHTGPLSDILVQMSGIYLTAMKYLHKHRICILLLPMSPFWLKFWIHVSAGIPPTGTVPAADTRFSLNIIFPCAITLCRGEDFSHDRKFTQLSAISAESWTLFPITPTHFGIVVRSLFEQAPKWITTPHECVNRSISVHINQSESKFLWDGSLLQQLPRRPIVKACKVALASMLRNS